MLKNKQTARRYLAVTAVSGTADLSLFLLMLHLLRKRTFRGWLLLAVVCPRIASAILNYCLHRHYTFGRVKKHSLARYCLLGTAVLSVSCGNACLWEWLVPEYVFLLKPAGDALLGIFTFKANTRWVFAPADDSRFYGNYARFIKWLSGFFLKRYPADGIEEQYADEPVVYVCRHGNMRGPVNTLSNFRQDIHPMVLGCFFSFRDCQRHYYEFTYSARFGIAKPAAWLMSVISACITVPIMHSLRAIPVHRSSSAISTLRTAVDCLKAGHSVIVFPDVSYTENEGDGEIYRGFVTIGHLYLKATGKPLRFVPLVIDEKNMRIIARKSYTWQKGADRTEAADYLRKAIHEEIAENVLPVGDEDSSAMSINTGECGA